MVALGGHVFLFLLMAECLASDCLPGESVQGVLSLRTYAGGRKIMLVPFFKKFTYFMCISVLPACMSV